MFAAAWYYGPNDESFDFDYEPAIEQEPTTPPIASTPGKLPTCENLGQALLSRPSIDELADMGILRAPSELIAHKLSPKLSSRPTPEAVKSIRKSPIEHAKERLARRSLSGALGNAIEKRPSIESLKARGITVDQMEQ